MKRLRPLLAIAVAVIAGVATIATSPAPGPSARDSVKFEVELTADQPTVARRVMVDVDNGGSTLSEANLIVLPGSDDAEPNPNVWVSLVPEDPAEPVSTSGMYSNSYGEAEFGELCQSGCKRAYVIVARLTDSRAASAGITVNLVASYEGQGGATPVGASATLTLDTNPVAVSTTPALRSVQSGTLEIVGSEQPVSTWSGVLHMSAAALPDGSLPGYPVVGRVTVRGTATESGGDWPPGNVTLDVGGVLAYGSPSAGNSSEVIEADWLSACDPGQDSDLEVFMELSWFDAPLETPPGGPRSVRYEFELIAELDYLGGATPPTGAALALESN